MGNSHRIAKNTIFLYVRMMISLLVSLYTSRIVLSALGFEDFGIYNVVGGLVAMFLFINYALSTSTSRYFAYAIGKNDSAELSRYFNVSFVIHCCIALVIFIGCETIGVWFMNHKMIIPIEKFNSAKFVFHISILTTLIGVLVVPFTSLIIAHEKMDVFAYLSLSDTFFKLFIAWFINHYNGNRLEVYAFLLLIICIINFSFYIIYCLRTFRQIKPRFITDKGIYKSMTMFTTWSLIGNLAHMGYTQGLNMLLNMFFGPIVNAARGIAVQVDNSVRQFISGFQTAINPQIIKSYANNSFQDLHRLIYTSSKISFFLFLILALPIFVETEFIMKIWLGKVPEYSASFVKLLFGVLFIETLSNSLQTSVVATGDIKKYQLLIGGILLSIVPITYLLFKLGFSPQYAYLTYFVVDIIAFSARIWMAGKLVGLSKIAFFKRVILKCIVVCTISAVIPFSLKTLLNDSVLSFLIVSLSAITSSSVTIYYLGLEPDEKAFLKTKFKKIIGKRKNE